MTTTYALKCAQEKYYIGKTNDLEHRLSAHFNNNGSMWTKKYPPVEVLEIIDGDVEKVLTVSYRWKYGKQNVAGCGWTQTI